MVRDMEVPIQNNKVYVTVSEDLHDGFLTLDWALRKWSTQSIIIVILYAANNICKDYVYTPRKSQESPEFYLVLISVFVLII